MFERHRSSLRWDSLQPYKIILDVCFWATCVGNFGWTRDAARSAPAMQVLVDSSHCVLCAALVPAAAGRRKVWLRRPGPVCWGVSECELSHTIVVIPTVSFQDVLLYGLDAEKSGNIAGRWLVYNYTFALSCAEWKDFNCYLSMHRVSRRPFSSPLQPVSRAVL